MFVADERMKVRVEEKINDHTEMIEKLDEMLTTYGVQHFFSLPNNETEDAEYIFDLFYDSEDRITVDLVYLLWAKTVRKVSSEKIVEAMQKVAA